MLTKNIELASKALKKEQIIGFPTETVYGLAGNAFSEKAIKSIFELKNRPFNNPLIVHISSMLQLHEVAIEIPEKAFLLAKHFWPGPLTFILKKHPQIPLLVTANQATVAVRMPNHPMALKLLDQLNFPLVAPSANPYQAISPTKAEHVEQYFKDQLQVILDGGPCEHGIESTIVGFEGDSIIVYREGSVTLKQLEKIADKLTLKSNENHSPVAPGMHSKHYAPKTPSILTNQLKTVIEQNEYLKIGILTFKETRLKYPVAIQFYLTQNGNLKEAAKNLYAKLHELDAFDLDLIIFEKAPDRGLGKTINDRLKRAASIIENG
ncbi:MAG: threonylcarbamoyl-AMP synthase [Fluviicola sp.]|nr:threonylcarbamoyl-AMP synthase [Fluviicola sp.]